MYNYVHVSHWRSSTSVAHKRIVCIQSLYLLSNWSLVTLISCVTLFLLLTVKMKWWLIVITIIVSVVGVALVVVGVILSNPEVGSKYRLLHAVLVIPPHTICHKYFTGPGSVLVYSLSIGLATHIPTDAVKRRFVKAYALPILSGVVCYIAELLQGQWLSTSVMMTFICDDGICNGLCSADLDGKMSYCCRDNLATIEYPVHSLMFGF